MEVRITVNGKVGIQKKYYTQLLGTCVVTGEMMPKRATPVGIKSTNGAHIVASFGSFIRVCSTIERQRKETARSQRARKIWINIPNVMTPKFIT
jgi:hypothetical protein